MNTPSTDPSPLSMGPYRVLDSLGRGSTADIYLAEDPASTGRKLVLKVMKPDRAVGVEARALSRMEHECIVGLHGSGTTQGGRAYLVLEHVDGVDVTTYADRNRLPIPQRLDLVCRVCEGLQHAHDRGVIHAYLTASDVLVTDGAEVKIIDFGRAHVADPESPGGNDAGRQVYMSPELARMATMGPDPSTDVYHVGVILYQLLVGPPPFDYGGERAHRLASVPLRPGEGPVPSPSLRIRSMGEIGGEIAGRRQVDRESLFRALRGDLDRMVLKAMNRDPMERYPSVAELARDIRRFRAVPRRRMALGAKLMTLFRSR